MKCPACDNVTLVMSEKQGVEIEYCPHCRGVWLDRGELDKILERSAAFASSSRQERPDARERPRAHGHGHGHEQNHEHDHKKKGNGLLEALFNL